MRHGPPNGNPLTPTDSLAADVGQGGEIEHLPAKVERYGLAHKRALSMSDYLMQIGERQLSAKLSGCGSHLLFRYFIRHDALRLTAAQFCKKHLICPLCAIRRGAKALKAYETKLQAVMSANPGIRPYLVTFTLKNGSDLSDRINHLRRSFRRLLMARRSKGYESWEIRNLRGGVWSYEVKRGSGSGNWHPHMHMIWLSSRCPDRVELSQEWKWATGDSYIVDARPIQANQEGSFIDGMLEVFKYAVKFSDMTLDDNYQAYELLQGARLIDSCGLLRGVDIPEELTDDELDGPYLEFLFQFASGGYDLVRKSRSWEVESRAYA